jgi:hypothetical protein
LANCLARKKYFKEAEFYYLRVIKYSPHSSGFPRHTLEFLEANMRELYTNTINSKEALFDAQSNLAFTYLNMNEPYKGLEMCQLALKSNYSRETMINFGNALRQVKPTFIPPKKKADWSKRNI